MPKTVNILLFFIRKSFHFGRKQLRKPTTIISFGGFALSIAILTASLTLLNGYQKTLKDGLLGANAHIYIYSQSQDKLSKDEINNLTEFLSIQSEVDSFSPVIMTQVMAVGDRQMKGILARSIQWQKDSLPINYHRYISGGSGQLVHINEAVLGSELANFLQAGTGDSITLLTPANMQYTLFGLQTGETIVNVTGIFHSGIYDTDSRTIFLNEDLLSMLTNSQGFYDMIEVKLQNADIDRADYLAYLWNLMLNRDYQVYSWIDYNSNLFTMLVIQKWVIGIILSFLVLIASFNIISNTTTSVLERKKEIGILKATGCTNSLLKYFFLAKTTILGLMAIIAGIGLGLLLAFLLTKQTFLLLKGDVYFIENFTIRPDFATITIIIIVSIAISIWAALVSLSKISQLTVIEIIRSG